MKLKPAIKATVTLIAILFQIGLLVAWIFFDYEWARIALLTEITGMLLATVWSILYGRFGGL